MIDDTRLFISFKAIQKLFNTISPGKFCKRTGLDLFSIQALSTFRGLTLVTTVQVLIDPASANLAPFRILAPGQFHESIPLTPLAGYVLRTQAACQPAAGDSQFSFHECLHKSRLLSTLSQ
jgi:hypothetical protein